jgi:hypothetical protein
MEMKGRNSDGSESDADTSSFHLLQFERELLLKLQRNESSVFE